MLTDDRGSNLAHLKVDTSRTVRLPVACKGRVEDYADLQATLLLFSDALLPDQIVGVRGAYGRALSIYPYNRIKFSFKKQNGWSNTNPLPRFNRAIPIKDIVPADFQVGETGTHKLDPDLLDS